VVLVDRYCRVLAVYIPSKEFAGVRDSHQGFGYALRSIPEVEIAYIYLVVQRSFDSDGHASRAQVLLR